MRPPQGSAPISPSPPHAASSQGSGFMPTFLDRCGALPRSRGGERDGTGREEERERER